MIPTGLTRVVLMIGRPVSQTRTPSVFNAWAEQAGVDVVVVATAITEAGLGPLFAAMRAWETCAGAVVTYPHKLAAFHHLDAADEAARFNTACNVIRREGDGRLVGTMTDGIGCIAAMEGHGARLAGADIVLVGAGGAGSAIAHELARRGVRRLVLREIDTGRRDALAERLAGAYPGTAVLAEPPADFAFDAVCNATPLGMAGDTRHPYPLDGLPRSTLVVDVVPDPAETAWIAAARARGHRVQTGPEMVRGQFRHLAAHLLGVGPAAIDPAGRFEPGA